MFLHLSQTTTRKIQVFEYNRHCLKHIWFLEAPSATLFYSPLIITIYAMYKYVYDTP